MSSREPDNINVDKDVETGSRTGSRNGSRNGSIRDDRRRIFKRRHVLHPKSWREYTFYVLKGRVNILLLFFIPAIVLQNVHVEISSLPKFFCSFLAIVPLSSIMTAGIEDLSAYVGQKYQTILHALSGNFVELVIESYVLMDHRYAIVRSAVLGSILCNITLVLGIAFVVGSWPTKRRKEAAAIKAEGGGGGKAEHLHTTLDSGEFVDTSSSILALAFLALLIPAAFKIAATPVDTTDHRLVECNLQNISHATAIILILVYAALLLFQLKTHTSVAYDESEMEHSNKIFNWLFDLFLIVISVAGITYCARILVSSIEKLAEQFELGTGFVGIVLLPICVVSNFIEHYQAIAEAAEDKVDTAIGIVFNTSVQMALLITPILVAIGWISGRPLTLDFNILEISVLGCAILIVNYLVADSKVHWLEGYMLVISYILIAIAFFYFPNTAPETVPLACNPWSRNLNKTLAEGGGVIEGATNEGGG